MNTILEWLKNNVVIILLGVLVIYHLCKNINIFSKKRIGGSVGGKGEANLVLVYAPWCGHSKNMLGDYERVKKDYHGKEMNGYRLNILKYSSEEDSEEVKRRNVKGFPTLFFEKDGKSEPFSHRTYDKIVNELKRLTS